MALLSAGLSQAKASGELTSSRRDREVGRSTKSGEHVEVRSAVERHRLVLLLLTPLRPLHSDGIPRRTGHLYDVRPRWAPCYSSDAP